MTDVSAAMAMGQATATASAGTDKGQDQEHKKNHKRPAAARANTATASGDAASAAGSSLPTIPMSSAKLAKTLESRLASWESLMAAQTKLEADVADNQLGRMAQAMKKYSTLLDRTRRDMGSKLKVVGVSLDHSGIKKQHLMQHKPQKQQQQQQHAAKSKESAANKGQGENIV